MFGFRGAVTLQSKRGTPVPLSDYSRTGEERIFGITGTVVRDSWDGCSNVTWGTVTLLSGGSKEPQLYGKSCRGQVGTA